MREKLREKGDTELLDGDCANASDWHGRHWSPSVVAMCRSYGSVADVTKVDSVDVGKVLCEDGWSKRLGGQSQCLELLLMAMYSICGIVADRREEEDIMVIMIGATDGIGGSVAWMWMVKLYQLEGIE